MNFVKKAKEHKLLKKIAAVAASAAMLISAAAADISGIPGTVEAADSYTVKKLFSPTGYGQKSDTQISKNDTIKGGNNWSVLTLNGQDILYCLEAGKPVNVDSDYKAYYKSGKISLTDRQNKLLKQVFLYSYTKVPSDFYAYDEYMPQYIATQILIWEVMCGQRDDNFNYVSNGYTAASKMLSNFNENAVSAKVKSYYQQYESNIKADGKKISFAETNMEKALKKAVKCNSDGTYTFTDKNGQLNNFDITVKNGKVVSKSATQLKVRADNNKIAEISFVQNNVNASGERCGMFVMDGGTNNQKLSKLQADPRPYYAALQGNEEGGMLLKKNSDDGVVAGLKFHVSGNGIDKDYITDKTGYIKIENLTPGTYTVSETRESAIYNTLRSKKVIVEAGKTAMVTFTNTVKTGSIIVYKTSEDKQKENFKFHLQAEHADGSVCKEYDDQITTKAGIVTWSDLPFYCTDKTHSGYGGELLYSVQENDLPARYVQPEEYVGYMGADANSYSQNRIDFENKLKKSSVLIVKKDYETGETVPREGTEFQILDSDGNVLVLTDSEGNEVDTFITDESGEVLLPEPLTYGSYQLVEVKAPEGYVIDKTPIDFSITENGETVQVEKKNTAQKGKITVTKTGDIFTSVETDESEETYKPVFSDGTLKGAKIQIAAAENIYTPDGTLRVEKDEVVDTLVTGEDGTATSKELYLGTYKITELDAPEGYIIDGGETLVTLEYEGQEIEITNADTSFNNNYQQVNISLSKELESSEKYDILGSDYAQYVKFGLYADEQITASDGTYIPKDGLIETTGLILNDGNANGQFNTKLPFGKYYVQEISTDEHYVVDDTKYPVDFVYTGQDNAVSEIEINNGNLLVNKLKFGRVEGLKIDADDSTELSGAVIGIFNADETEFSESNAIETTESAKDGSFSFEKIPVGNYLVKEIEAPEGYVLTDKTFPVVISEDGDVVEITIENEKIRGSVQVKKYDLVNKSSVLSGAVFEVYKDVDGNEKFDASVDESYGLLNEIKVGIYQMDGVEYGGYFLKETKAPEGYQLDENYYYFEIRNDGETVIVSNDESTDRFYNDVIRGNVHGLKVDADDRTELSGALMGLFKSDETDFTEENALKTTKSAKDGSFEFNDIKYGKYIVAEIEAPKGYILTDKTYDVEISVNGVTIEITVPNRIIKGNVLIAKHDEDYPQALLKGAKFAIYEDTDADGVYTKDKDKFVAYMEESSAGIHEYKGLPYGDYFAKETVAPKGYKMDTVYYIFSIRNDGETVVLSNNGDDKFYNRMIRGKIDGLKVGESDEPLEGALIGLFESDETDFTKDNALMTDTTDKKGKFAFEDVNYGKYIVAEIKAPTGYILTDKRYSVNVDEDGETIEVTVENEKIRGKIDGIKVGESDEPLEGAVIGLFKNGETEFVKDNALMTDTTDKKGKFAFAEVEFGKYIVAEIKAPTGYILTKVPYPVEITKNDQTIEITVTNGLIRGNVVIEKYDSETDAKLSGAEFTVYADTNGNGKYDAADDKVYDTLSETSTGIYELKGIAYGNYLIKETKAPEGYYIDDSYYSFAIEKEGETVKITNNQSSDRFYNAKITTTTVTTVTTTTTTTVTTTVTTTSTSESTTTTPETTTVTETTPVETTTVTETTPVETTTVTETTPVETTTVTETTPVETTTVTETTVEITTPSVTTNTVPYITTVPAPSPKTGDVKRVSAVAVSLGLLALAGMMITHHKKGRKDIGDYIELEDDNDSDSE